MSIEIKEYAVQSFRRALRRTLKIKKPEGEDLGLNFDTYLMDAPRPCSNHCLHVLHGALEVFAVVPAGAEDDLAVHDDARGAEGAHILQTGTSGLVS